MSGKPRPAGLLATPSTAYGVAVALAAQERGGRECPNGCGYRSHAYSTTGRASAMSDHRHHCPKRPGA